MRRLALLLLLIVVTACGDSGEQCTSTDCHLDAAPSDCDDPTTVLPTGFVPIDSVSTGMVSSTAGGASTTTLVDASAGGFGGSDGEPFVYLSFSSTALAKQSLTDVDSYDDATWHLALKRYVIRANGGDSGPAEVRVAMVTAGSLDQVTTVPSAADFGLDDWATAACELVDDDLGAPLTAMGDWFDAAGGMLTPRAQVYVLALPGDEYVKLRVVSYYANPADATQSGYFELEWAPL